VSGSDRLQKGILCPQELECLKGEGDVLVVGSCRGGLQAGGSIMLKARAKRTAEMVVARPGSMKLLEPGE
jgi:hypothetical protein